MDLIRKNASEFRGSARCNTLRKYDGVNQVLNTFKESVFDDAILMKDLMKAFVFGEITIKDIKSEVDNNLDAEQCCVPEQLKAKAERMTQLLYRACRGEKRQGHHVKHGEIQFDDFLVTVHPDVLFRDKDYVELVLYRAGKPTVTRRGKKMDGAATTCLELYFMLLYARTFVPVGETMTVKASYYFLRKGSDTKDNMPDQSFFGPAADNIVTLAEEYTGGDTKPTELDESFLQQIETFKEGEDHCPDEVCSRCKMFNTCFWKKSPERYEQKSLSGKQGKIIPSDEQQQVIDFRSGYCKVNAGAGTGKTECMTERGARMFAEGVDPSKMLFITFTEAGATEMKERLAKKAETRGLNIHPEDIRAMTFNAFDFEIVKPNYEWFGYEKQPKVIDRVRNCKIITELLTEKPIAGLNYINYTDDKGALNTVARLFDIIKSENIDVDGVMAPTELYALAPSYVNNGNVVMQDVINLYKKYNDVLKNYCLVQFADQEPLANKFLDAHPDYLEETYGFEHIIVDEFQDSNDGQLDKIKRLCACPSFKSLMVVGDDSQAIYSFRHTSPDNIINFFEKMNVDGTELFLTKNRRSSEEIISFANKLNDLNKEKVDKTMESTRGPIAPVKVEGFHSKSDEYDYIAGEIVKLIANGTAPEEIAFIAFTRDEIEQMGAKLSQYDIPWVMKNPLLLLKNSRINAAISLAMSFYDPEATKSYFDYLSAKYDGEMFNLKTDSEVVAEVEDLKNKFAMMDGMPFEAQRAMFHNMLDSIKGNDEIYAHFLDLVYENEDLQSEIEFLRDFHRFGEKEEKKMEQTYQGVVLVTAHSSKGLEWKYVFNSISKYYPQSLSQSRLEEMRRLFFVSGTRARDYLTVTGQYIAFGTKETGYTQNLFLQDAYSILGKSYDPVDHEAEKRREEAAKAKLAEKEAKKAAKEAEKAKKAAKE